MEQPSVVVSAIYFLLSVVLFGFGFYMMACEKSHMLACTCSGILYRVTRIILMKFLNKRLKQPPLEIILYTDYENTLKENTKFGTEKMQVLPKKFVLI